MSLVHSAPVSCGSSQKASGELGWEWGSYSHLSAGSPSHCSVVRNEEAPVPTREQWDKKSPYLSRLTFATIPRQRRTSSCDDSLITSVLKGLGVEGAGEGGVRAWALA